MNLSKLFEMQKALDDHIIKEKHLTYVELLPMKIFALRNEIGELANEVPEYWKFWSNKKNDMKKALEEYVDCVHFILSIGLDLNDEYTIENAMYIGTTDNVLNQFNGLYREISHLDWSIVSGFCSADASRKIRLHYQDLFKLLIGLGELLGFNWDEIEQAYMSKNAVNHQRQVDGY